MSFEFHRNLIDKGPVMLTEGKHLGDLRGAAL